MMMKLVRLFVASSEHGFQSSAVRRGKSLVHISPGSETGQERVHLDATDTDTENEARSGRLSEDVSRVISALFLCSSSIVVVIIILHFIVIVVFFLSSMLNKEEMKQSFCDRMPFLSPTSRNHSLDLIFSLTTKTPEQGRDVTPFTSALRCQYPHP